MGTIKRAIRWVMVTDANTAEENTNRSLWWLVGIIAVTLIAGIVYFMIGHLLTQAQGGVSSASTSLSSQSGLTTLAQQAENGTLQVGTSSVGSGKYAAP